MARDYYEILGVSKTATDAELKKAYHKLVMKYHPDRNPGDKEAEAKFKEVNSAYDALKDPQKRAAYDQFGENAFNGGMGGGAGGNSGFNGFSGFQGFGGGDFSDMFEDLFSQMGFGGGRATRKEEQKGRDLLHDITITLHEAFTGKTETVEFSVNTKCDKCNGEGTSDGKPAPVCPNCRGTGRVRRQAGFFATQTICPECEGTGKKIDKLCSKCHGKGITMEDRKLEIKIPAGVENGTRLRFAEQGEAAAFGGRSGDLFVDITVKPDPRFQRDGNDLYQKINIPFTTLALGGKVAVPTIDGPEVEVQISNGTQINERLRLRGKGMPNMRRADSRGDMYLIIGTEIPTKLSTKQKEILEQFAAEKHKKGWF